MTLPDEMECSINQAREWLSQLVNTPGPVKKKALRQQIRCVLRHFPGPYEASVLREALEAHHKRLMRGTGPTPSGEA